MQYTLLEENTDLLDMHKNDTVDKNGKPCAFTYNQRYTTYSAIMNASKTSEL